MDGAGAATAPLAEDYYVSTSAAVLDAAGPEAPPLELAVRALAEFACREGDLDAGHAGPSAEEGRRAHVRVQREWHAETEVALSREVEVDGVAVRLSGRIDLLDADADRVGEIKTVYVPPERLAPSRRALHRAQAKLYAWLHLAGRDAPVTVELVYANLRAAGAAPTVERFSVGAAELEAFALAALRRRVDWQRRLDARRAALERSARTLDFPHAPWRPGQRTLAAAVWRTLRDGEPLLIEAPTGIGKTVAALYPAIKALGEGGLEQVQWLTAKNSGRAAAFAALDRFAAHGLEAGAVLLRARAASCFCERGLAERDAHGLCAFARGFHDRLPAALDDALEAGALDGERLDALAMEHQVCPHTLARSLLPWSPIVVCDYNHVHDPLSCVPALVERAGRRALLVDEAHNLAARARAMHGAALSRSRCLDAAHAARLADPELGRALEALAGRLHELGRALGPDLEGLLDAPPESVGRAVTRVLEALAAGREHGAAESAPLDADLALGLARYRMAADAFDAAGRVLVGRARVGRRAETTLELVCLDASGPLASRHGGYRSVLLLSGTLRPFAAHARALGLPPGVAGLALDSPYDASRLHRVRAGWIDVRAARREASLPELVELLEATVDATPGHYLAFLPSYAYLERAHVAFARARPDVETWAQGRSGGEAERTRHLERLSRPGTTLGFAIVGGSYGEGVDYVGDRLVGAVVVGTGLPALGRRVALEREYHEARGRDGFDHACRVPGLARVLQSAGRVIRGESDRGVVTFVDPRFGDPFYRRTVPAHLAGTDVRDIDGYRRSLATFWRRVEASGTIDTAGSAAR